MDEINRLIDEKRAELGKSLRPLFGDDSGMAAAMMVGALCGEFCDTSGNIKEDDQARFLVALGLLPSGSKANPMPDARSQADGTFQPIFLQGGAEHQSLRRFPTRDGAERYGTDFKMKFLAAARRED
ncbi:MAG: hypothetical protein WA459_18045 [Stellaceae bacterium]